MRQARVFINDIHAGTLEETASGNYRFIYQIDYQGIPVSLTMPIQNLTYEYAHFPAFFEGLLPEGAQLEALLKKFKLERNDYFGQLMQVGHDLVGAVTVEEIK